MENPFALTGKKIFITGAGSGIGRATALQCAGLGATVYITDLNEATLAETLGMLEGEGHLMYVANLTYQQLFLDQCALPHRQQTLWCHGLLVSQQT